VHWGENVYPYFDDGCHLGHSYCNPEECDDFLPAFVENERGECPKCGSKLIDQISSEDCGTVEWFHCYNCGCWYNENGEIDEEENAG